MHPAKLRYRPHIDGLRALAVLAVLAFHAFPKRMPGGFLGVDVFFVISGYLISSILYSEFAAEGAGGGAVIRDFYCRRVRRIFPALIVVLVACYALGYFQLLPSEFAKLSLQIVASAGFCLNFVLAKDTGYFNTDATANPVLHLWSLGVEEQFYLLWPLVIWFAVRSRVRVLPVAVFLAACSFFWNGHKFDDEVAADFFLPQMRLWELLIGAITAALFPVAPRTPAQREASGAGPPGGPAGTRRSLAGPLLSDALSLVGLALIGSGFFIVTSDMNLPNKWTLLPTIGTACVICSGEEGWVNRWILSNRFMVWIGLISYPLYLWHWPLLSFSRIAADNPDSLALKLGVISASVLLAWLTYWLIEKPVRRAYKTGKTMAGLVGAMAAIICLGGFTKWRSGFPTRFPPLVQQLSDWKYDPSGAWREGMYFLMTLKNGVDFKADPNEIVREKPTIFLWGDSHAAALYPGFDDVYGKRFNIIERTVAGVPPFVGNHFTTDNARETSQLVLDSIRQAQPEYVVLEADWEAYDWARVEETIGVLKAAGIRHVVLVGPVPHWHEALPQLLFTYMRRHKSDSVPVRMSAGLNPQAFQIDGQMASMAGRLGIEYISPCHLLQNKDGVLVRTGDTADSLVVFDNSHLTSSGSLYLVSRFPRF
jgi:peptidoglycan/LPS O-acetylase OafA/YrhL